MCIHKKWIFPCEDRHIFITIKPCPLVPHHLRRQPPAPYLPPESPTSPSTTTPPTPSTTWRPRTFSFESLVSSTPPASPKYDFHPKPKRRNRILAFLRRKGRSVWRALASKRHPVYESPADHFRNYYSDTDTDNKSVFEDERNSDYCTSPLPEPEPEPEPESPIHEHWPTPRDCPNVSYQTFFSPADVPCPKRCRYWFWSCHECQWTVPYKLFQRKRYKGHWARPPTASIGWECERCGHGRCDRCKLLRRCQCGCGSCGAVVAEPFLRCALCVMGECRLGPIRRRGRFGGW